MKVPPLLTLAGLSVLLGSCAVGPNHTVPENAAVTGGFISPGANSSDPGDLAQWWRRLNDPKLNSLITRALDANQDLKIAASRVAEARAARAVARSGLFPQVNATGSATRSGTSENASGGGGASVPGRQRTTNFFDLGLDASWEIDVFGGTRRGIEAAGADLDAAGEAERDVRVGVISEVAIAYTELRGYQARKSVAERNIKSQRETLELTRSRLAAGVNSDLDVARAESQVEATAATLPTFEAALRRSIYRLGVLLGGTPGSLVDELLASKNLPATPPTVPVGLQSDLLRRRPDVRRSERELAAATARIGVAVADLYPRFKLTGASGLQSIEADTLFKGKSGLWSLGPSLSWPVFSAGRIRANIKAQTARQEQAGLTYEKAVLGALEDVEGSLISFGQEQKRYASLTRAVDASRRASRLASDRYKAGITDFLDVLDADRAVLQAEDSQVESQTQVALNFVRLYKALGGGWEKADLKK